MSFINIALFGWPIVVLVMFRTMTVPKAAAASIIMGYLLLPKRGGFDLPLLPAYDHALAASLPALLMAMALTRPDPLRRGASTVGAPEAPFVLEGWLPKAMFPKICLLLMLAFPLMTSLLNDRPLVFGTKVLPALGPYDAAASALTAAITLLPFAIARKYLAHPREHTMLLLLLCLAGLVYTLPALYEVRMSPQINRMVYGFAPEWMMSQRGGGWRPSVFLGHGLRVGLLFAISVLAALACWRLKKKSVFIAAALWLLATLVLSKTLGALIIAVVLAPILLLASVRLQLLAAAVLASIVLVYPVMRSTGLVPTDRLVHAASVIGGPDRAASLQFRFDNEDKLLRKANQRPVFGWGGWGRARVYTSWGASASTTDGVWIIAFGEGGWTGYLSKFGLLTIPLVMLAVRRNRYDVTFATSALALVLVANLLDLIPNSGLTPLTWLIAGALIGRMEIESASEDEPQAATPTQASPYRRTFSTAPGRAPEPAYRRHATRAELRRRRSLGQDG